MHRPLPLRSSALDALMEERDHRKIQISLLSDCEQRDHERLRELVQDLAEIEKQISVRSRAERQA